MNEFSERTIKQMEALADRLISNQDYMAWVIAEYQRNDGASEETILQELSTDNLAFLRLRLCKAPDTNSINFASQIEELSSFTGIEIFRLADIIRKVEVLNAMQKYERPQDNIASQTSTTRQAGFAAARDSDESCEYGAADNDKKDDGKNGDNQ